MGGWFVKLIRTSKGTLIQATKLWINTTCTTAYNNTNE